MGQWQSGQQPVATRLARVALRAQRLSLLHRIDQIQVMVRSHTPELQRTPNGAAVLAQVERQLREARQRLLETSLG